MGFWVVGHKVAAYKSSLHGDYAQLQDDTCACIFAEGFLGCSETRAQKQHVPLDFSCSATELNFAMRLRQ
jgi:hypothetical protein